MSPVDPVSKVDPVYRATEHSPFGKLSSYGTSAPTSPKTQELRARYEALQAKENDLKFPKGKDRQ